MTNPFPDIILSCNIPSKITIDQCADEFVVDVFIDEKKIYSTTLQGVNSKAVLYDLDTIVTEYMRANVLTMAQLSVNAILVGTTDTVTTTVIYSDLRTTYEDDDVFVRENYLTTRSFFLLPKNCIEQVRFFATPSEAAYLGYMDVACKFSDDSVQIVRINHNLSAERKDYIYSFSIEDRSVANELKKQYPTDPPIPLSATIHHGKRVITFFFADFQPDVTLIFYNAFNCPERAYIFGTTTQQTDLSQKEAVFNRTTSFYSRTSEQRFKVETASLSLEEAFWLNQLMVSSRVLYEFTSNGDQAYVLIDDVNSEIPFNSSDPIRLKFSYRFTQNTPFHLSQPEGQVYGTAYSQEFD